MEHEFIDWLRSKNASPPGREQSANEQSTSLLNGGDGADSGGLVEIEIGIGDDAAVVRPNGSGRLIVTTDTISDGTHFLSGEHAPELIGRKAVAVNFSDIAAMGGRPEFLTVSITCSRDTNLEWLKRLYLGCEEIADSFQAKIIGGDTNRWDGKLTITVTAVGSLSENHSAWNLSGGKTGDAVMVTGAFGGSLAGRHLRFTPRLEIAGELQKRFVIHSATDASDGLIQDLARLAQMSGCGVELETDSIPVSGDAKQRSLKTGQSALDHAMYDGEDFELIFTCSESTALEIIKTKFESTTISRIGTLVAESGIRNVNDGVPIRIDGYRH